MNALEEQIRSKLKGLAKGDKPTRLCQVTEIDEDANTITAAPLDGGAEFVNVRLQAVAAMDTGVLLMPAQDSYVLVELVEGNPHEAFVTLATEFKWIAIYQSGELRFKIDQQGHVMLHGDAFGGLVKINELVGKINQLEAKHNALCAQLEAVPVPVTGAVSGPPVPGSYAAVKIQKQTTVDELQNERVKHG